MDIFRIPTFFLLTAFALAGCGETIECEPGTICGDSLPSDTSASAATLSLRAPTDVQREATGILTIVALGQATATGGANARCHA